MNCDLSLLIVSSIPKTNKGNIDAVVSNDHQGGRAIGSDSDVLRLRLTDHHPLPRPAQDRE